MLKITLELKPGTAGEIWSARAFGNRGEILKVDGPHALVVEALRGLLAGHDQRMSL